MTDPAEIPKLITLGEGFVVRQEIDNIAWADMGGYGLVIDALEHAELEGEVFAAIRQTLGDRPVRYVLNTHTHYDHVALNPAFARAGSEIINQELTPIGNEGRWFLPESLPGKGSRRRAFMLPLPGCHTQEDCVVHFPDDGVLFVGDLFGWGLIPLTVNLRQDTATLLLDTYRRLIEFNARIVVPGHGPLIDTAALVRWTEYFRWLIAEVRAAAAAGRSDEEIVRQIAPPPDLHGWWRFLKWKHADSVAKVLKSVRRQWL